MSDVLAIAMDLLKGSIPWDGQTTEAVRDMAWARQALLDGFIIRIVECPERPGLVGRLFASFYVKTGLVVHSIDGDKAEAVDKWTALKPTQEWSRPPITRSDEVTTRWDLA